MGRMIGSSSISFDKPPFIIEGASIVGQKEGDGPLGKLFDVVEQDPMLGQETWEEAESLLQKEAIQKLLFKAGMSKEEIRYIFGGDWTVNCHNFWNFGVRGSLFRIVRSLFNNG